MKKLVIGMVVLAVLFGIGVLMLRSYVRRGLISQMGLTRYNAMQQVFNSPVNFPPGSQVIAPASPAVRLAMECYFKAEPTLRTEESRLENNRWEEIVRDYRSSETLRRSLDPLISATSELVRQPGFYNEDLVSYQVPPMGMYSSQYFELAALWALDRGESKVAMDYALDIFRSAQHEPLAVSDIDPFTDTCRHFGTSTVAYMMQKCEDRAVLARSFRTLRALESTIWMRADITPVDCAIGELRKLARSAYKVDMSAQYGKSLFLQIGTLTADVGSLSSSVGIFVYRETTPPIYAAALPGVIRALRFVTPDVLAAQSYQDSDRIVSLSKVSDVEPRTRYTLLEIALAEKIRLLRGDGETTDVAQLVPEFFPTEPKDPYTSLSFHYSKEYGEFYSIGPDKVDNKLETRYSSPTPDSNSDKGDIGVF